MTIPDPAILRTANQIDTFMFFNLSQIRSSKIAGARGDVFPNSLLIRLQVGLLLISRRLCGELADRHRNLLAQTE